MKKLVRKRIKIGYKKAAGGYIVKLQILGKNNEKRENISDQIHAKYRCSKVKVLDIFHYINGEKTNSVAGLYDPDFTYILNQTIETDFDENLENVCSTGIHYFKTLEQAKYWYFSPSSYNYTGDYKEWDDQGNIILYCFYKNAKYHGEYKELDIFSKTLNTHCFYKDGELHGECKEWDHKGRLITHCVYKDGKLHGEYKQYNKRGILIRDSFYKNGNLMFESETPLKNRIIRPYFQILD